MRTSIQLSDAATHGPKGFFPPAEPVSRVYYYDPQATEGKSCRQLAKEKGYRARAAFKLIQLNRKYNFLEKSKVLLDLCAAPGSWCQVAAETMPIGSLIVGVDLAPIKPIPRTVTFQNDITTDKCRAMIRQYLKTWKADTVLHDGAPNVGTAWVQDAFSQAELVLQAMKLATEFLMEGGTFVTKVFRSKDYNALLWVFNQLFNKVESTKPPSSRNVSAEIFVVCRGFKAPKRIDPKFLDPRSVFAELADPTPNNEAKVFNPEVKKRKRDGYEEGNYTQFKEAAASEFIQTTDPIAMLGSLNRLSFDQNQNGDIALTVLEQLPETTIEIRQCCSDLKVLGRKEFRALLRWRLKAREKFGFGLKKRHDREVEGQEVAEVTPMDEELRIQEELHTLAQNETSRKKRDRRKENERKQREILRMQMHMMPPTEIGLEQAGPKGEDSVFALSALERAGATEQIARGGMILSDEVHNEIHSSSSEDETDEEEDRLDRELESLYERYQQKKSDSDATTRAKKAHREHDDGDWAGFSENEQSASDELDEDENSSSEDEARPILSSLVHTRNQLVLSNSGLTKRASSFFDQDIFRDIDGMEAVNDDDSAIHMDGEASVSVAPQTSKQLSKILGPKSKHHKAPLLSQAVIGGSERQASGILNQHPDNLAGDDETCFEVVRNGGGSEWERQAETRQDGHLDIDMITAEAMTLAQQIATRERSTRDVMDEAYNKYAFQDRDGLPDWFLDDEGRHSKPHRPISAAGAAAIKEKLRVLNARPIKKVREAKDRKKFKAAQRLEKLRKKSALLASEEGMTEKDKAQNIAKMMSVAAKKKPRRQVKVVVARGGNRGISGRPRGVKGKYKIVDARLKKDVRAEKRLIMKRH
ncbi:MAG: hypothetical protein Q9187_000076 [Circinaria calcarea]